MRTEAEMHWRAVLVMSARRGTVRDMSTDISMQTTTIGGSGQPSYYLPGPRPDDLPISAAVWDVAKNYGKQSEAVVLALYEAVKKLEANQQDARS